MLTELYVMLTEQFHVAFVVGMHLSEEQLTILVQVIFSLVATKGV